MKDEVIIEKEYKEILLQVVAVIETSRSNIARYISTTVSNTYWEIGKLLYDRKLESRHGSGIIKKLSVDLKERYPQMGMSKPILEQELERRLVEKIKLFLLELGKGFTFIGNQYVLEYNGKESRVDLLFFHRGLHCLVAIDLKIGKFIPEYAGKMNYYLSILDRIERQDGENPSIGIILCAEKDHVDVELALEGMTKPIGVADYHLIIPKDELVKTITAEIQSFQEEQENTDIVVEDRKENEV